ncbi:MAG: substrate-binding domain-containing protein, partial [Geminicoccaceae bacterium]|nr:substrate-binding domain-containing protein [Geminicoccaceae bacterium]
MLRRHALTLATALLAGTFAVGPAAAQDKPVLAFVTNAAADFWTIGRAGVMQAGEELDGYTTEMHIVSEATAAEQRRIIDDLLTRGVAGITVSVIDPANSRDLLNRAASQAVLFTSDSDAADTDRMLYVGTDNVAA